MKIKNTKKQNYLKILPLALFSFFLLQTGWSQTSKDVKSTTGKHISLCSHEHAQNMQYENNPEFQDILRQAEKQLQNTIKSNEGKPRNKQLFVIPIVFHILHEGSPLGSGDNISDDRIFEALNHLNSDFADANGVGTNVNIQFCLAQQDPNGNSVYNSDGENITGIQRADASGINQFSNFGIWAGMNEVEAKALSNWPEEDYVNVWVAHRLFTGSGDAAGFAYFPPAGDEIDGIALRTDATGLAANSKVIAHEAGHFFWLFHTFEGGDDVNCPANGNCATDGDRICETRIHNTFPDFPYDCDESEYEDCDPNYNLGYMVSENHMNYTDNSCRDEFVPQQAERMRTVLQTARAGLLNSIGCSPGCPGLISSFTFSPDTTTVSAPTLMTFTSTSSGAVTFSWTVDGIIESTNSTLVFDFTDGGIYEVCLDVTDGEGCISRSCVTITVIPICIPPEDPCERVINGNFEQIGAEAVNSNDFGAVCGWDNVQGTSFFCNNPSNNAIGLLFSNNSNNPNAFKERIVTTDPLDFEVGDQCRVSFDYLVTNGSPQAIQIALIDNNNVTGSTSFLPANATIISEIFNPSVDYFGQTNHLCYDDNFTFHHVEVNFTFTNAANEFLTITGIQPPTGGSIVFVDNVSINCCEITGCTPLPDFTWDGCLPTTFTGTNAGDPGDYTWNFLCDLTDDTGQVVTKDLAPGSSCEVCLTVNCDMETSATVCQTVTIDPECEPDACLAVEIKEMYCINQGTADPDDDYWYFSMVVTDLSGDGVFWEADGDITAAGSYDDCKIIWPSNNTIGGNPTLNFTICDSENSDCCIDVSVDAPESCSVPCDLDVDIAIKCDINDEGFNEYYVESTVDVGDSTTCFMIKRKNPDDSEQLIGTYYGSQTVMLGPFSPLEEFTLWFVLCEAPDYCIVDYYVNAPDKCENCLDYYVSNITCYNNGTTNPDDDYWSFDIIVDGPNDFWISTDPPGESGSYNNVKTIFVSSFDDLEFLLFDNKKKCKRKVVIEAPEPCSYDCDFEFEYKTTNCKYVEGNWVFNVVIHINSSLYECFTIKKKNTDNSEEVLGDYPPNTDIVLGPFEEGEDFSIWVMACGVFDCVLDTWIAAPDCGKAKGETIGDVRLNVSDDFQVNIYPIPTDQQLTVEGTNMINTISIFNATGELVENLKVNDRKYSKDLDQFKSGVYFMRVIDENGKTAIKKFLKID